MKASRILFASLMAAAITAYAQGTPVSAARGDGPSTAHAAAPASVPELHEHSPRYRLRKSDNFDVNFEFVPEFNQSVTVQPDGFVTLKEAGSIHVEGQTLPELTATLKEAYAKILHDPVIAVVLKDFERPFFIASGQITKPGKYELRDPLTVAEAVAVAGGFNDSAKHSQVVLFHPTSDGVFETKILNVKKLLGSHNLSEDIYLQPGDMLYVPQSAISKIRKFIPATSMGAYYNPAAL